jgi:hypothetical protein
MRVVFAVALVAAAVVVAMVLRRRRTVDVPTQPTWDAPTQLDRADFTRPEAPWLVAVFSSDTCDACAKVVSQAEVVDSTEVAVDVISYQRSRPLHERYAIGAVPITVIADAHGVVRHAFVGPHSATDLWARLAEARNPGTTPFAPGHDHG